MSKKKAKYKENLDVLRSMEGPQPFDRKGIRGEMSNAILPFLQAWDSADEKKLPARMSKAYRKQASETIRRLKKNGLRRSIRITDVSICSGNQKGNHGFIRWNEGGREWREGSVEAALLEQYIDIHTDEVVWENYDPNAVITIRQCRHIRAKDKENSDKKKSNAKNVESVKDYYIETYKAMNCPSCGAEVDNSSSIVNCAYCGAHIVFNFYDWQTESFDVTVNSIKIDVEKAEKIDNAKEGALSILGQFLEWFLSEYLLYIIGGIIAVVLVVLIACPGWVKVLAALPIVALIGAVVVKNIEISRQEKLAGSIVRYSESRLRSRMQELIWERANNDKNLIDLFIGEIKLKSVNNTDSVTTAKIAVPVIKKLLDDNDRIEAQKDMQIMTVSRARYPDRIKSSGVLMAEKECPSCGGDFQPDKNGCCSYCGYGLQVENYIWQPADTIQN